MPLRAPVLELRLVGEQKVVVCGRGWPNEEPNKS